MADAVPFIEMYAAIGAATVLLLMGRLQEAEEWRARGEAMAVSCGESAALLWYWFLRGRQLLREGRLVDACESFTRVWEMSRQLQVGEPCIVPWVRDGVEAFVASGRRDEARRLIDWLDACAGRLPCRWPRIAAATGRALLAEQSGDHTGAEDWFSRALALHAQVTLPLERVETLLSYGGYLRRAGQLVRARPLLAEALAIAEDCGAGWLAGRARQELTVAGGRRRRRGDPERLTAAERRVAELAAAGHSNQEIATRLSLAVSTVETHLQHTYAKLGLHSRRELIAHAAHSPHDTADPR